MSIPYRPGTARRLGIRAPRPTGIIEIAVTMPRAELGAFEERLRKNIGRYVLTLDNRKPAPRRRWWQRRNR